MPAETRESIHFTAPESIKVPRPFEFHRPEDDGQSFLVAVPHKANYCEPLNDQCVGYVAVSYAREEKGEKVCFCLECQTQVNVSLVPLEVERRFYETIDRVLDKPSG